MSNTQSLLALWLIYMGVALSPGVNFALIGQTATQFSRREALLVASGVVSASALWMSAALFGLVALAQSFGDLFSTIRIVAGLYLIMLGLQKIRQRNSVPASLDREHRPKALWRHYLIGFATGMGNPKAILFFGTLFATALPTDTSTSLQMTSAVVILASSVIIHAGLASVLSVAAVRNGYLRARRVLDPIFGVAFIAFGTQLLVTDSE